MGGRYLGNITAMAREKGLNIVTGYFNPDTARSLRVSAWGRRYRDRQQRLCAQRAAGPDLEPGRYRPLAIAACCVLSSCTLGDSVEQEQWDTLYHEHLTFYSLARCRPAASLRLPCFPRRAAADDVVDRCASLLRARPIYRPITPEMAAACE